MANSSNRWDTSNWTPGKVTLAQALGLSTWNIQLPKLQTSLQQEAIGAQSGGNNGNSTSGGGNLGGTGAANGCTAAETAANQKLGQQLAATYGWSTGTQWSDLNSLIMAESGWCNVAQNPTSTAFGIGQFLNTTWATVGGQKTSNATVQIKLTLAYIKARYGSPQQAWAFHLANGWY